MIVHWPKGIKAKGEVRDQYTHVSDIVPTVYDCLGIELPPVVKGYTQWPLEGQSFKYSFDDAKAPTQKDSQYYVMLGTRGIWRQGWKADTVHARRPATGATSPKMCGNCSTPKWIGPNATIWPTRSR